MPSCEVVLSLIFIWTISHYCFLKPSVLYQIGVVDVYHMCLVFYVITEKEYIAPSCCRDFAEKGFLSWLIRCLMFGIVLSANTFGFRVTKTSPAQIAG